MCQRLGARVGRVQRLAPVAGRSARCQHHPGQPCLPGRPASGQSGPQRRTPQRWQTYRSLTAGGVAWLCSALRLVAAGTRAAAFLLALWQVCRTHEHRLPGCCAAAHSFSRGPALAQRPLAATFLELPDHFRLCTSSSLTPVGRTCLCSIAPRHESKQKIHVPYR